MRPLPASLLAMVATAAAVVSATKYGELKTVHEWDQLDFAWLSAEQNATGFKPENCAIVDVKVVDGELFVTVPRIYDGVPATVNHVLVRGSKAVMSPYPSWGMNTLNDDCKGIQNAIAIEIDPLRRMWIVDSGTKWMYSRPNIDCPPKLLVWDMVNDREVRRAEVPLELRSQKSALLRDVVVDTASEDPEEWFAYIAETTDNRVLIYSWKENTFWNVSHHSMEFDRSAISVPMGKDQAFVRPISIDSLALTARGDPKPRLFFAALASYSFHAIPTAFLKNRTLATMATVDELNDVITRVGTRFSQSQGMSVSSNAIMFYSVLYSHAIYQWNTSAPFSAVDEVYSDDTRLQHADSFGWDGGFLYVTSNRILNMPHTASEVVYRVLRADVAMDGYMGPYRPGPRVDMKRRPLSLRDAVRGGVTPRAANAALTLTAALLLATAAAVVV